jgi:hypothetical protein
MTKNKSLYPRLTELGVTIEDGCVDAMELEVALLRNKLSPKRFDEYFGVQTVSGRGPYAWDVEAVLERMMSGKVTGTQLHWD